MRGREQEAKSDETTCETLFLLFVCAETCWIKSYIVDALSSRDTSLVLFPSNELARLLTVAQRLRDNHITVSLVYATAKVDAEGKIAALQSTTEMGLELRACEAMTIGGVSISENWEGTHEPVDFMQDNVVMAKLEEELSKKPGMTHECLSIAAFYRRAQ